MTENQALAKMVAPWQKRQGKPMGGVIQIWVTRQCDKACFHCTQFSNLVNQPKKVVEPFISEENFRLACKSLRDYFGVVGVFGGNPSTHPNFPRLCEIMREYIPYERRGLWCNNPINPDNARAMRETFNPAVSNLNVHLDKDAYEMFKLYWPESMPFGLHQDSRHSPVLTAMKDVIDDESKRWELISNCTINQHWSALVGVFRGQLRGWFCEIAGSQSMLYQHDPDYPDTGVEIFDTDPPRCAVYDPRTGGRVVYDKAWWKLPMSGYLGQVRKHCHECGVPLNGYGELAQAKAGVEQVSATHADIYKPKRPYRPVRIVTTVEELQQGIISRFVDYVKNAAK